MIYSGAQVDAMLGGANGALEVRTLTYLFLGFYFLAATQDIAVDGLALTILSPRNKEIGATCNSVGQSLGYFLSFTVFLALNSPDFCNAYLRESPAEAGLFSLGDFMSFWGWVFLASTVIVFFVKKDEHEKGTGVM
eukprot:5431106-Prymnesium_polylepis.1